MTTTPTATDYPTAEVRVLTVDSQQVTIGVARQLDFAPLDEIDPFGRLNVPLGDNEVISADVLGRHRETGALVRSGVERRYCLPEHVDSTQGRVDAECEVVEALPLLVLSR
ncbi:hypothetical protein [Mycobacterium colombiense]|uniref:Uncharacterized protein n=1 Tax=Mycobacterium colombiense TaxID=339268 RepID=A0A1A2Z1E4_9MYCO|nr:hypothetical protein [Mycobacterium colombiense]OBI42991.1 hypothetical protein A5708_19320 [Mycobacterium colombiense]